MTDPTPRVIRLTEKLLADLPVGLACIAEEIEYLDNLLSKGYMARHGLRERMETKRNSLQRVHAWLASKIEAEQHHRADAPPVLSLVSPAQGGAA